MMMMMMLWIIYSVPTSCYSKPARCSFDGGHCKGHVRPTSPLPLNPPVNADPFYMNKN